MIRVIRVLMLAGAIACGVTGLYLSGVILAVGVIILAPFDTAERRA